MRKKFLRGGEKRGGKRVVDRNHGTAKLAKKLKLVRAQIAAEKK